MLYAFARARDRGVICLAHVTILMGPIEGDVDKGEANGAADALRPATSSASSLQY